MSDAVMRAQAQWDKRKKSLPLKNCLECHDVMFPMRHLSAARWKRKKFCQNKCRARYYMRKRKEVYKQYKDGQQARYCRGCKRLLIPGPYVAKSMAKKFCSHSCRANYYTRMHGNIWGRHLKV